jgi:hypothetical protein
MGHATITSTGAPFLMWQIATLKTKNADWIHEA